MGRRFEEFFYHGNQIEYAKTIGRPRTAEENKDDEYDGMWADTLLEVLSVTCGSLNEACLCHKRITLA
jgi:hypothetical protein